MKKFLSVLLSLMILISITGVSAYAAPAEATAIAFEYPSDVTLDVGKIHHNPAVTTPRGRKITYTSSDPKVASVHSSGRVTGISAGTTTITAKSGNVSASYDVTVVGSGTKKPNRVRIVASQKWVRVNRTIELEAVVQPYEYEYDYIEWYTLDYDLVSIDDYGAVTGLKPGVALISVYVYVDGPTRRIEVGSAEIEIEVRGALTSYSAEETLYDPDKIQSSSSKTSTSTAKKNIIPTKTVNDAVKKALVPGTTKSVSFKNYTAISTVSLESAAAEMQLGGGVVLLNFDTLSYDGRKTEGRLTLNPRAYKPIKYDDPLQVGHTINVTLETNENIVLDVKKKFEKFYKNDIFVIKAGHSGKYGMSVTCAVNTGTVFSKAKASNLKLYTYDPKKGNGGTFRLVKNPNISVDGDKNVHFTTDTGDYLILSNGVFAKR